MVISFLTLFWKSKGKYLSCFFSHTHRTHWFVSYKLFISATWSEARKRACRQVFLNISITLLHKTYVPSPGNTKLASWIQQSQTVWLISALHAYLKICLGLERSTDGPLYMCSLRVMTSCSNQPECLLLLSSGVVFRLHNTGIPCVIALTDSLSHHTSYLFPGFNSPHGDMSVSASRGLQRHIFVLELGWERWIVLNITGQTKRGNA